MVEDAAKHNWVERVLGITIAAAGDTRHARTGHAEDALARRVKECQAQWNAVLGTVYRLSKPLHAEASASLPGVARGLDGVLESYWSDMTKSLTALRGGKAGRKSIGPALDLATRT